MVNYKPIELEEEILDFWEKKNLFEKATELRKKGSRFSFYDGPPTANNEMGVHHSWGRTYKDLMCRFKSMQGFNVRRQPGFDCQGLWVEVEVEKALGFKTKGDIEEFGIEKFSRRCKERVLKFVKVWIDLSKKLGVWMDWDNAYLTMTDGNIELVWYFLKKCHENGWLYEGFKVLPWCPRCETSLSSHEVSLGYRELTHDSVYLKFPIKNRRNEYLLVWTTTPWTLAANTAVAVHPDLTYIKVKQDSKIFYLLKKLSGILKGRYEVLEEMKGKKLLDLKYESPYVALPAQEGVEHKVIPWKEVSEEEGTGIVHIAPGCGPEDYELGKEFGLSVISPLNEHGEYLERFDWLKGKPAEKANPLIIEDLEKRGILYKKEKYTHRYPCCWRCEEELVFRLVKEWFIKTDEIRPKLLKENEKIEWSPDFVKKHMVDWLENMEDWCISRKRYWGLPLPIWRCGCGNIEMVGTKKELEEKAVSGLGELKELHRPWIDEVVLECSECGAEAHRIPEVGDCWLDAGIMPFSTLRYLKDKGYWEEWYPADFITEMQEQVKLWFYSILFMGVTLANETPFKSALTHGPVQDETGREMHKSWGNAISAEEALSNIGADIMRWMFCSQNNKLPIRFGYERAKEVRKVLNVLFNTGNFVKTYCELNDFEPKKPKEIDLASKWVLSRLQNLKKEVTRNLEDLKPYLASRKLQDFFLEDFSRWYIHLIRDKVKRDYEGKDKESVLYTLYHVFLEVLKLMSPFTPFLTESLYQNFYRKHEDKESIHLMDWPEVEERLRDLKLEGDMEIVREVSETARHAREKQKLKLRWPIKELVVVTEDKEVKNAVESLKNLLLDICNVKSIRTTSKKPEGEFAESEFDENKVLLDLTEDKEILQERMYRELTRKIQSLRKKYKFVLEDRINLTLKSSPEIEKTLERFKESLKKDVGAKTVEVGKLKGKFKGQLTFKDKKIDIRFGRV